MIKSPFITKQDKKAITFQNKLKRLFEEEKVEGVFVFYIPQKGDVNIFDYNLCSHQLETLAEAITDMANKRSGECE